MTVLTSFFQLSSALKIKMLQKQSSLLEIIFEAFLFICDHGGDITRVLMRKLMLYKSSDNAGSIDFTVPN
jgi:hypothetical protein